MSRSPYKIKDSKKTSVLKVLGAKSAKELEKTAAVNPCSPDVDKAILVIAKTIKTGLNRGRFTQRVLITVIYYLFEKYKTSYEVQQRLSDFLDQLEYGDAISEDRDKLNQIITENYSRFFSSEREPNTSSFKIDENWVVPDPIPPEGSNGFGNINQQTEETRVNEDYNQQKEIIESSGYLPGNIEYTPLYFQSAERLESTHYDTLLRRFDTIQLRSAKFKMSIQDFVKKALLIKDDTLKNDLESLELKKMDLRSRYGSSVNDNDDYNSTSEQVRRLRTLLEEEHDIIDVIELGMDIFIQAPAGYGKSTMLGWLAYQYASSPEKSLPIFISLMDNSSNNLHETILDSCDKVVFDNALNSQRKIILFLDGFDQFTGTKPILFKQINIIKKHPNIQIVFSGRSAPNMPTNRLAPIVYTLKPFDLNDIKKISYAYLKKEGGIFYDYVVSKNLISHLERPLYLCFALARFKRWSEMGSQTNDILTRLSIVNKAKLIQDVVVEYFLSEYEQSQEIDIEPEQWTVKKHLQLDLICKMAYHMTIDLKDSDIFLQKDALQFLENASSFSRNQANDLLIEIRKHNIFLFHKDKLSFEKKELRLFFTATFLAQRISNYQEFEKEKAIVIKKTKDEYVWKSIQDYLVGLIDPESFFESLVKINLSSQLIFDEIWFGQYLILFQFVDQRNIPTGLERAYRQYLIDFSKLIIERYNHLELHTNKFLPFLFRSFVYALYKKSNIPAKYVPAKVANTLNGYFVAYSFQLGADYEINNLLFKIANSNLGLTLDQFLDMIEQVKADDFRKSWLYDHILRQKEVSIRLSLEEKLKIAFYYYFPSEDKNEYTEIIKYKTDGCSLFAGDIVFIHCSHFFNLIFEKIGRIPQKELFRFIRKSIRKDTWKFRFEFSGSVLLPENAVMVFDFVKDKCIEYEEEAIYGLKYMLMTSTDPYLVGLFQVHFGKCIQDTTATKEKRLSAFYYFIRNRRPEDLSILQNAFQQKDQDIIDIVIEGLINDFPNELRRYPLIHNESLVEFYCEILESNRCTYGIATNIFIDTKCNSPRMDEIALNLLKKDMSKLPLSTHATIESFETYDKPDFLLKRTIIQYMGEFKIKDAVPCLEKLLKYYWYNHQSFYSLFEIDCSLFTKHKHLFKEEYQKINEYLSEFIGPLEEGDISKFYKALYVGDRDTLNILEKLRERLDIKSRYLQHDFSLYHRNTINSLVKKLRKKCNMLDSCQKEAFHG